MVGEERGAMGGDAGRGERGCAPENQDQQREAGHVGDLAGKSGSCRILPVRSVPKKRAKRIAPYRRDLRLGHCPRDPRIPIRHAGVKEGAPQHRRQGAPGSAAPDPPGACWFATNGTS